LQKLLLAVSLVICATSLAQPNYLAVPNAAFKPWEYKGTYSMNAASNIKPKGKNISYIADIQLPNHSTITELAILQKNLDPFTLFLDKYDVVTNTVTTLFSVSTLGKHTTHVVIDKLPANTYNLRIVPKNATQDFRPPAIRIQYDEGKEAGKIASKSKEA
jgi:hypothetical protein